MMSFRKKPHLILLLVLLVFNVVACVHPTTSTWQTTTDSTTEATTTVESTTEASPIAIASPADLLDLNDSDGDYVLASDIDLSGIADWTPIEEFTGTLDGDGHAIRNLKIASSGNNIGLFAVLGGTVRNLVLEDVEIHVSGAYENIGCLAGENRGTIDAVTVSGIVDAPDSVHVGGVLGFDYAVSSSSIDNVLFSGSVEGAYDVGGIVGRLQVFDFADDPWSVILADCGNAGTVTGTGDHVGGIVGYASGSSDVREVTITILDCENAGAITGSVDVGGILGYGASTLEFLDGCVNAGDVTGETFVGGIAAKATRIDASANSGIITASAYHKADEGAYVGGIAGYASAIENCTNEGIVQHDSIGRYVGGIVGYLLGSVLSHCTNEGAVSSGGDDVGGIAGYVGITASATLQDFDSTTQVAGLSFVGGIIGYLELKTVDGGNQTMIMDATNHGYVIGNASSVGGIVGRAIVRTGGELSFQTCVNAGEVAGDYCVGGIVGYLGGNPSVPTLNSCMNEGTVNGNDAVGDLYGMVE
jgi:hypothetical protein